MYLTKEKFLSLYQGREDLYELLTTDPQSEEEFVTKYLPSKLWRLNNLYKVIDKAGDHVQFKLNYAQFVVYAKLLEHPRLIILKSRQQGISTFALITYLDDAIFVSNYNCGLMAQGKEEAGTLLERLKFAWDHFDPDIKSFLNVKIEKDNSQEFKFTNNSSIFIRTSFRSATLQRLHISELGKIANKYPERAKETKTGTLQALAVGNTGIIESTAEGVNMFKHMWDAAVKQYATGNMSGKDFLPVFLSWVDDPDCVEFEDQYPTDEELAYFTSLEADIGRKLTKPQRNFWIMQHRELEGDIHQEYPGTPEEAFTAAQDGTYWAKRYLECVIRRRHKTPSADLHDINLDTYVVIDSGRDDYFVMTFFQVWQKQIRIVYEYYNNGEWLGHYVEECRAIAKEHGFSIAAWYLPHDMGVIDITQKEGKTREEVLNDLGVSNTILIEKRDLREGIEEVRQVMPSMWFAEECQYLEQCMLNYSKEWDPVREVWKREPKRNQWCHGADTIRYLVQVVRVYHTDNDDDWEAYMARISGNVAI